MGKGLPRKKRRGAATEKITSSAFYTRDFFLITMLVVAALAIRLYFHQFYRVISADGIGYVGIAADFINGRGLSGASHFPPFYPMLVGFASLLFKDFELAGRAVSIVMGSLVVIPVYLLGKEFACKKVGFLAAILTMSWWSLRNWSGEVMSQATYITLLLLGVYLLWTGVKRRSTFLSLAAGGCLALAHLTRSEGIIAFFAVSLVILAGALLNEIPGRDLRYLLFSWLAFWCVFSPYFILLHKLNGSWQLTGKSRMAIADGLSMYLGKPDIRMDPRFVEMGYLDLFRRYPDYIWHNISVNFRQCWSEMLPLHIWILSLLGLAVGGRERPATLMKGYLLATFAPLVFICLFFFIGPEYTQPYLPVLFLWAGQGVVWLEDTFLRKGSEKKSEETPFVRFAGALTVVLVVVYAGYLLVQQVPADRKAPYNYEQDGGRYDDKQIGMRLRGMIPEGAVIMTRSGRIGFYSQRPYVLPAQAGLAEMFDIARKSRVSYIVATIQLLNVRPQLRPLYAPLFNPGAKAPPPPGLELVYAGREPGGLPYLLYRLK